MKTWSLSQRQSRVVSLIVSPLLILLIGIIDYITGYELGLSLFYLIPICVSVWFAGKTAGCIFSVLSTEVWMVADLAAGRTYVQIAMFYWNASIRLGFFLVVTFILSSLKASLEREKVMARTDSLTGALNAGTFMEMLRLETARAQRLRASFTLAYIDLDHFKSLNDRLGHSAGDDALRQVAAIMRENLRETDLFGRLGGDEFAILFSGLNAAGARSVIPKIQKHLLDGMKNHRWPVTFSIGVLSIEQVRSPVEAYIQRADRLMYAVKKSGKNSIRYDTCCPDDEATDNRQP